MVSIHLRRTIGCNKKPEALDTLIALAASQDWCVRNAAAGAMKYHEEAKRALPVLRKLLLDSSPYVVRTSCTTLAELQDAESHDNIFALINSSDLSTRITAIQSLSNLYEERDFDLVFEIYKMILTWKYAKKLLGLCGISYLQIIGIYYLINGA